MAQKLSVLGLDIAKTAVSEREIASPCPPGLQIAFSLSQHSLETSPLRSYTHAEF
jgi:hypothetical protein